MAAERFTITLPNFHDIEQAYSTALMYNYGPIATSSKTYLNDIHSKSKLNLDQIPIHDIQSLNDC
jgi:hypothetical protein